MAGSSRFRFSLGRLMIELGLLALPLGLIGGVFDNGRFDLSLLVIVILLSGWFVFAMEVVYACLLRPEIVEPWERRFSDSIPDEPVTEGPRHPLD